jgi:hypothetical protein
MTAATEVTTHSLTSPRSARNAPAARHASTVSVKTAALVVAAALLWLTVIGMLTVV